ncbi:MAG: 3-keto-5-aminohexanoate cleavage protein [Halopseudomonas sp.]
MQTPSLIIVAPNGARRTKADHPALPITPAEMVDEVAACAAAGAAMVHLHARDSAGRHSLAIADNAAMLQQVNDQLGDQIVVQLTTEAVGIYQPEQQMQLIRELQPEAASFALRELVPDETWLDRGAEFFGWVRNQGILAQYILYSADDLTRYFALLDQGVLPADGHHLLFVLGRYSQDQQSSPQELLPFLQRITERATSTAPWALCAFGQQEQQCLAAACSLGGDARVGFENNLLRSDGSQASSNAEQVAQLKQTVLSMGRELHDADSLRQFYGLQRLL